MKFLVFMFWGISFSAFAQDETVRDTLIGKFSKHKQTLSIGQQVAQQGTGYSFGVERAYLKAGGQVYKIYRLTRKGDIGNRPSKSKPSITSTPSRSIG